MGNSSSQENPQSAPLDQSPSSASSANTTPLIPSQGADNNGSHRRHLPRIHRHHHTASKDRTRSDASSNPTSPISPSMGSSGADFGPSSPTFGSPPGSASSYQYNPSGEQQGAKHQTIDAAINSTHIENAASLEGSSTSDHIEHVENADAHSSSATASKRSKNAKNKSDIGKNSSSSNPSETTCTGPVRRQSTLLLQGEPEPDIDEDMDFNKLSIATGEPVGKPLSRAGSGEEIQLGDEEASRTKYDTIITWHQGGKKVYITGSFTEWRKMIKLNNQPDGTFSVVLKLPQGTHRMRFVVDNELQCSDFLPSATDSMGNLVNYIEVPSELSQLDQQVQSEAKTKSDNAKNQSYASSMASAATAAINDEGMEPIHRTSSNYQAQEQAAADTKTSQPPPYQQPFNSSSPNVRLTRATTVEKVTNYDLSKDDELLNGGGYERFQEELPAEPVLTFTSEIPRVFEDPNALASFGSSDSVTPPQLPPHLESVILNSNSNEKDNNSVLPIPNHVVLNHLATTSIKHNVLAVATVSRYSRKYVTQILYAPLG